MNLADTIIACASPPGASARGLIRLSGEGAWAIVEAMSDALHRPLPRERGVRAHRLVNGWPCLLLTFPGPRSYTGQDVIEIALPGNITLLARVVSLAIERGARQAEAGEFTARAWFNGRMTLTQAEGVAATIAAASDAQLRAARSLSGNRLGRVAADLCEQLAAALALVEAGIDFTEEEDVVAIAPAELASRLDVMLQSIDATLDRAIGSEALSALPRVVLVGPPNAGKSTLYNVLLGRSRAVISEQPGTTRDALAEPMHLDLGDPLSPEVLLIDVAGLDDSPLGFNPQMQRAAAEAIDRADLLVALDPLVEDAAATTSRAAEYYISRSRAPVLVVQSKGDLAGPTGERGGGGALRVSAVTGEGLALLRRRIAEALGDRLCSPGAETLALLPRHEQLLREAHHHLAAAQEIAKPEAAARVDVYNIVKAPAAARMLHHPELIAASMRSALDALGSLAGAVTPDDVLGRIFAGFCIGK